MKIAFDIGGVLTKYPEQFWMMINALHSDGHIIHFITDVPDKNKVMESLHMNGLDFDPGYVHCADYDKYGEVCKAVILRDLRIDIFFDDFMGYLQWDESFGPAPIRLLVMPDGRRPMLSPRWNTPFENIDFMRKCYKNEDKPKSTV